MELYSSVDDVPSAPRAVAIGSFDGVHRGHQAVISKAKELAQLHGLRSAVITFNPHPESVLRPKQAPKTITPLAIKSDLIAEFGVDDLVFIPFDKELSKLSAEQFCQSILVDELSAKAISVGENFRFGSGAQGDVAFLKKFGSCNGIEISPVGLLDIDGETVSSSLVRKLLNEGDVTKARDLLGHSYELEGEVIAGTRRGRELGVPTANIVPDPGISIPAIGIYAGYADGEPAAISVGVRPTYSEAGELIVEVYVLDRVVDLYGKQIRVKFIERLRDELKFDSDEALITQMQLDINTVRELTKS